MSLPSRGTSWAKLRASGFKRCIGRITSDAASRDGAFGTRKSMRSVGAQCRDFVSKAKIAERGLPLCAVHYVKFQEDVAKDAATRAATRARLDPGPLPLDDD